ncbi:MAG: cell division protein ZapA [Cellvibrionales bacterium]|jgi:cell division protein ZapA|nr:cell division protein ZapA [Cellvibrionales bacterium]MBK8675014.1 cell division protein ZapA [Cellvibrionales bacterium]HRF88649.1 cell division protein ZapA [Pseudomonadales bacterium]HRG51077.1 cell division protein ZapA [Pseudomonadales bacterium]
MSTPTTVRLRILDNDYQVACPPEEQEGLLKAGRYLDDKMRAIRSSGNVIGTERIAVLVGLNIAHELLQQTGDSSELQRLTDKITRALGSQSQLEL